MKAALIAAFLLIPSAGFACNSNQATIGSTCIDQSVFNPGIPLYISGSSVTFSQDVQASGSTVTFSATQTINWQTQGPRVTIVLTANTTSSSWSAAAQRGFYYLTLVQDGTGSRTYTWPSNIVWPSKGSAPTLTTTANARDYFSIYYDTDLNYHVLAEALNN